MGKAACSIRHSKSIVGALAAVFMRCDRSDESQIYVYREWKRHLVSVLSFDAAFAVFGIKSTLVQCCQSLTRYGIASRHEHLLPDTTRVVRARTARPIRSKKPFRITVF
jgi:hypothetical protein